MDINGDGILDLFTPEYSPGTLHWFEGTKTGFKARQDMPEEGKGDDMNRWANATSFVDWNGDKLTDLLVGSVMGGVYVNLNQGSKTAPKFGKREPVKLVDGSLVKVSGKSAPIAIDWDRDRVLDLLVGGEEGQIFFFKGTTSRTFEKGVPLQADGKTIQLGFRTKLVVVDWNRDGRMDLLVGDAENVGKNLYGYVYLILQKK